MTVDKDFADIAEKALRRGLAVHPLKPLGKEPLLSSWNTKASRDPAQIAKWAELYPTSNYGVVADETYCILESDNFSELRDLLGTPIPRTYTVGARANRPHVYFLQTASSKLAGNMDCAGIFEFKQHDKYVVGEGSIHPTGPVYTCLNDDPIIPIPDWLVARLVEIRSSHSSDRRVSAPLPEGCRKLGEGERHPVLVSQAAKMWDGVVTETEFFDRLYEINLQHCEPPKSAPHVMDIVRHFMERKKPIDRGPQVILRGKKAFLDPFDFVLASADGEDRGGGCFASGSVHLIQGASGSGKTTLGLQMLEAQRKSERFLGRKTFGKSYIVLMGDRGSGELIRTLDRMKMPDLPCVSLTSKQMQMAPAPVVEQLYMENGRPQIIFIEGLDMWVKDQSSMDAVSQAITSIREVAAHYGFSVIGTVGTPKAKPKERYADFRDRAFGSTAWSRMVDTVMDLVNDPKTQERTVCLGHRNAQPETFHMEFDGGRLVRKDVAVVVGPEEDFIRWFEANPEATCTLAMDRFGWGKTKAAAMLKKYRGGN